MPAGHDISVAGAVEVVKVILADVTRSSTTAAVQADLTLPLDLGVYVFNYYIVLQSAATTTGHKMSVNFSGTEPVFAYNVRWVTAASAASDDIPDQDHVAAPGGVVSAFTARASSTTGTGQTTDVDTANGNVLYIVEGIAVVTVAGNLEFYWAPEAAANATIKAGSSLIVWRTG